MNNQEQLNFYPLKEFFKNNLDKLDKLDWSWLSYNPAAIHLLEKNP